MIWREAIVLVFLLWTSLLASAQTPTNYDTAPGELRPILLTGAVVLGSGEAPIERIAIQQRCGPRTVAEVYTDSKGRFSFQIGGNSSLTAINTRSSRLGTEAPSDQAPAQGTVTLDRPRPSAATAARRGLSCVDCPPEQQSEPAPPPRSPHPRFDAW